VIANAAPGNQPRLEAAPLILVAASDRDYHELVHITAPGAVGLRDKLAAAPDARVTNAHDNTLIQVGYLIVGLRAAGLSVRPMGGFDRAGIDDAFFGGSGWHAELLLAVGYPADDGDHGAGDRRPRPVWDDVARVF
jgi:3-hydroxypropanoate dehydrogenase